MKLFTLTINETQKLISSKIVYVLLLLTAAAPLCGFFFKGLILAESQTTLVILAPVKFGTILCAGIWAVFTIYEMDRMFRFNTACIVETTVSMLQLNAAKTLAILIVSVGAVTAASIVYLPYSCYALGSLFDPWLYVFSYFIIMLPGVLFSILLSSSFYAISRRMDISFLLFGTLFYVSYYVSNNYILQWIQTCIPAYSDCFGNALAIRTTLWNRLVWSLTSGAAFILGILCTRRYEKNVLKSIAINVRKTYLPITMLLLAVLSAASYVYEPYFDASKDITQKMISNKGSMTAATVTISNREENTQIALSQTEADIIVSPSSGELQGKASYFLKNNTGVPQDVPLYLQPGYSLKAVKINGKTASFRDMKDTNMNEKLFKLIVPANKESTVELTYGGKIKGNRLSQSYLGFTVISNEYINLRDSALIPSLSVSRSSNIFSGKITLPSDLMPITTGAKTQKVAESPNSATSTWSFHHIGKNMALIAGKYSMEKVDAGGINIEFYYSRAHEANVKEVKAAQVIKEAVDFYTASLGKLDYTDIPLKIVDNTVLMLGGKASENICFLGEHTFDPSSFKSSSYEGTNGAEVLAHEICHEWWGISVKFPETGEKWTSEGLAEFTTYKFLQKKYGDKYAEKVGVRSWEAGLKLVKRSFYYRHPEYLKVVPDKFLFNILASNNNGVIYNQMPLEIYRAEQLVGEDTFQKILGKLYRRNKNNLTLDDFLRECKLTKEGISVD